MVEPSGERSLIGWHGHNDRGLSVINSLAAVEAGADVIHGCALGIGERVGNTPMDQVLVNLKLLGAIDNDLLKLKEYCELASRVCKVPIPAGYPVFGSDAFRTATGVHAAAVIKAFKKGEAGACEFRLFGRAVAHVRSGTDHRYRPDERQDPT